MSGNNQIFITTHSPTFVRLYKPEEVCLIRRNKNTGTTALICDKDKIIDTEKKALQIENYFDNQRNELFFAKGIVLVEGATEKFTFPYVSMHSEIDIDRYGISIIECGGKGNLLTFAKVADAFDIPFIVIADDDIKDTSAISDSDKLKKVELQNKDHKTKNDALKAFIHADNLFWMLPNIEGVLGISENSDNKIKQARDCLATKTKADMPADLLAPMNRIMKLVGAIKE